MRTTLWAVVLAAGLAVGCSSSPPKPAADDKAAPSADSKTSTAGANVKIERTSYGKLPDGEEVELFTLTGGKGLELKLIGYGARIVSLSTPDRDGKPANVTLGFDSLDKYLAGTSFFGCIAGRYANRIAKGKFTLDGQEYTLATNNGTNHLHGGKVGFDKKLWKAEEVSEPHGRGIKFSYRSPDGEEGYPGNLDCTMTYFLSDNNEMRMEYTAKTDKPTVVNLTNHAYWNLAGPGAADMLDHELTLAAKQVLPVDAGSIPTGELADVEETPFDFQKSHTIGSRIEQLPASESDPGGYDHCYVLDNPKGELKFAARVKHPSSGRVMEISTTQPGVQFYTGNYLKGDPNNGGYQKHAAFCLETQHYPDSPNRPEFPSTTLRPGETYHEVTVHKFSVE